MDGYLFMGLVLKILFDIPCPSKFSVHQVMRVSPFLRDTSTTR